MRGSISRAFDLQKGIGIGWELQRPDLRKLDKVLKTPWAPDGELYSDRIWKDKQKLVSELNAALAQGLAIGKPLDKIADSLAERLSVKKSAARRLLYTEASAVTTLAEKDCYEDLGVGEYEILATLDQKTSEICRSMDGKHFPVSEMRTGVNAPPFHPHCRTDTCPYFDDWEQLGGAPMRAARDENGQGYELVPADMTYQEWEKRFVKEKPVENTAASGIIKVESISIVGEPNSITEFVNTKGGIDRNYYGSDGRQIKQISNHNHGNLKYHPFGKHGEHAHDYTYDSNGALVRGKPRELTDQERKEIEEIL